MSLFESARLLLFHENSNSLIGSLEIDLLRNRNVHIQGLVVRNLAKRRKELQYLAEANLPNNILGQVRLRPDALIGYHAGKVWRLLKSYKVETDFTEDEDWLVYASIRMDIQLAEMLWNAGFKDVDVLSDEGFTCLMVLGADPYRKRLDSPALHYVAKGFGLRLLKLEKVDFDPWDHKEALELMNLLQRDSYLDSCVCACSKRGCCVVTSFVRASTRSHLERPFMGRLDGVQLPDWYKYATFGIGTLFENDPEALFRALTFETLEIRHTCVHVAGPGDKPKHPDEIKEMQWEWEEPIQLLEQLTDEFVFACEHSHLSIFDFLENYWNVRMEECLFPSRSSRHKDIRQLREIGIILEKDHAIKDQGGSEERWEDESEEESET
ncbi:uncharacterized protein N7483_004411 [Penicillium malachiteum]|uniref:uncharacterized protein n=1 Tax=Penicillium malachiteum TaxID=1324776 RepID=UPI0025482DB3|nr:uncharacterized protein N7483_004411 [Penicillium malachiteum]KAJ5729903.1 hypothetical protein N7483_004411 [Penicillium malachiteum]